MPEAPPIAFRCPICRSQVYKLLTPSRTESDGRRPPVYECGGCSILFRDPAKLTRFEPHSAGVLHPAPDLRRSWK